MSDEFYRAFEDKFRGSRDLIAKRLEEAYRPFLDAVVKVYPGSKVLDVGCGRGEWLELTASMGFHSFGIDLDAGMLAACLERGLQVSQNEATEYLQSLESESLSIVSAFHVVEHISFDHLRLLVEQSFRVLKPGGLLIMETPNPENISVATSGFYVDPTHIKPIPSELLSYIPSYYGFQRVKILRLNESPEFREEKVEVTSLMQILRNASPDYAVLAQKKAPLSLISQFDSCFAQSYGLEIHSLADRYDTRINQAISTANTRADLAQAEAKIYQGEIKMLEAEVRTQQAEVRAREAELKTQQAETLAHELQKQIVSIQNELHTALQTNHHHWLLVEQRQQLIDSLLSSRSWRITKPIRDVAHFFRRLRSRPQRFKSYIKRQLQLATWYAQRNPTLHKISLSILPRFPTLKLRLKSVIFGIGIRAQEQPGKSIVAYPQLTPQAQRLYAELKCAVSQSEVNK